LRQGLSVFPGPFSARRAEKAGDEVLQTRLLRGESSLEGLDLPVLQVHALALSGEGPPAYDDAIFAAV
jgi:hypothetical protein